MNCICTQKCQIRVNGQPVVAPVGMIKDFKKCPEHWRPLKGHKLDFGTASEDELMASDWKVPEILAAAKSMYGIELKVTKDSSKKEIVEQFLYARKSKM